MPDEQNNIAILPNQPAPVREPVPGATPVATAKVAPVAEPEQKKRFTFTEESVTMALEYPVTLGNGEQVIDSITIRKPHAGEMRGLSLFEIMHMDMDTLLKIMPRITTPTIHKVIADELDPSDLTTISKCISGFFGSKKQRKELITELEAEYLEKETTES